MLVVFMLKGYTECKVKETYKIAKFFPVESSLRVIN